MSSHRYSNAEVSLLAVREEEPLLAVTLTELENFICCLLAITVGVLQ